MSKRRKKDEAETVAESVSTEQEESTEVAVPVVSKSEQRRRAVMSEKVKIEARVNAKLPDGTFVPQGETVEVSSEYADRLRTENDKSFIIK